MKREQDPATKATYFTLHDGPVARTVTVSDLIMVDLAEDQSVVGVEFAFDPAGATDDEMAKLSEAFPGFGAQIPDERAQGGLTRSQRPTSTKRTAITRVARAARKAAVSHKAIGRKVPRKHI
jgi:uncharacterized protein YuzE